MLLNVPGLPDNDDISHTEVHAIDLSNEDTGDSLVQCCTIHVDCGPDWSHEPHHIQVHFVLVHQAVHCERQGCRAMGKEIKKYK